MHTSRRTWLAWLAVVMILAMAGAPRTAAAATATSIKVLHASPDAPAIDVYCNGSKVASSLTYTKFGDSVAVASGTAQLSVFNAGADPNTASAVLNVAVTLRSDETYVFAVVNKLSAIEPVVFTDTVKPRRGYFRYRMVNVAFEAGPLDLVNSRDRLLIDNVVFKTQKYVTLPSGGSRSYVFRVRQHGTANVLLTLPPTKYISRARSTVWVFNTTPASGTRALDAAPAFVITSD